MKPDSETNKIDLEHEEITDKQSNNLMNYNYAIMCGLLGSAAAQMAKQGLQADNGMYRLINTLEYGWYLAWILRGCFFFLMIFANMKMLEYKIRSFALIGSSMTVVAAFLANYLFNLIYDVLLYYFFPTGGQLFGSICCLAGIYMLKDELMGGSNKKELEMENVKVNLKVINKDFDAYLDDEIFGGNHNSTQDNSSISESKENNISCVMSDQGSPSKEAFLGLRETNCENFVDKE